MLLEQIYIFFFILASSFVLMLSVSGTHSSLLLYLPTRTHRYTLVCMDGLFMNCVYAHTNRCIRLSVVDTSFLFVCFLFRGVENDKPTGCTVCVVNLLPKSQMFGKI